MRRFGVVPVLVSAAQDPICSGWGRTLKWLNFTIAQRTHHMTYFEHTLCTYRHTHLHTHATKKRAPLDKVRAGAGRP